MKIIPLLFASFLLATTAFAHHPDKGGNGDGLANTTVLIIRHAEKPESGSGLAPAGVQRAEAYVNYFKNFTIDSKPVQIDYLFATADSKGSMRPRLTITPLSRALGIRIDTSFDDQQYENLAAAMKSRYHGHVILICWHHGKIPELVQALGGDSTQMFPQGKWDGNVFGGIVQLRYDGNGKLIDAKYSNEHLMPDDQ